MLLLFSCNRKEETVMIKLRITDERIVINPTGYSPLTAFITFRTSVATKISVHVKGKHGGATDIEKDLEEIKNIHHVPVYGLYPDYKNSVELIFKNIYGTELARKVYEIQTDPLPTGVYPIITINKRTEQMSEGMTMVSYYGFNGDRLPQNPFIFDAYGDIRWYLALKTHPELNQLLFENGIERLQNGNLYFGDATTDKIYEMDLFGTVIDSWPMPGYNFHHNVQEKPNGNFLVTVDKLGAPTVEDHIIEIDRSSKQIINIWDLNQSLQNTRRILTNNVVDWIHVNALIYDESDNTIIISGRTQCLVKLDETNNVVWILGCHKDWGISGKGIDLKNYLLQPLDNNDQRINDQQILDGNLNHPDFEWNWYQHAPLLKPDGNLLLFDNGGNNRNFIGADRYSRAVEYAINVEEKTVKQIWEYGKDRGLETFSSIVSDVDYLPSSNHVIFSPGSVRNTANYGKVIEIDYTTKNVVFEATITMLNPAFTIAFHRTECMNLYR